MNGKRIYPWLLVTVALSVAGCNNQQTIDASSGAQRQVAALTNLIAKARPPIPDVPVPIGFSLDEGQSHNYAAAGVRIIDHVYKGGEDKFDVGRFYRKQMPVGGWTLVTDTFARGNLILDFEKDMESCSVTVGNGSLFHRTFIQVELRTRGRVDSTKYNQ